MKFLLALLFVSCAHETAVDKRYKCVLQLVKEGVSAKESAEACKYTYRNQFINNLDRDITRR